MSLDLDLESYLSAHWGVPVRVENLHRIPGGASRQTYRFDVVSEGLRRGLILRRDPQSSLIDTDRRIEYLAYKSFHPLGLPVPEPLVLEQEGGVLERPFFLMTRIDGGAAASPFSLNPYAPNEALIGRQFFSILGAVAAADPSVLPLSDAVAAPALDQCWVAALNHWETALDKDELSPHPLARAAIRTLKRNPPPPAQKVSVVHGDYRSGNFLFDGDGRILAILDWEMAHLGDPLEDLAWAMDPIWRHFDETRVAGMATRAEAIDWWETASGLTVEPEAFAWWELFASLKGSVIWTSAAKSFRDAGGLDPVLGFTSLYVGRRQDQILAEWLESLVEGRR